MNIFQIKYILKGVKVTLFITILSMIIGMFLGFIFGLILNKNNYFINLIIRFITGCFRRTPIILQLFLIFFVFPIKMNDLLRCIIIIGMNSASYMSEIFYDNLKFFNKNINETANMLGFSERQKLKYIVLPIIFQENSKTFKNEFVTLLKETSVVGMFGIGDISLRAREVSFIDYDFLSALIISGVIYYTLNLIQERYSDYLFRFILFIL